MKKKNTTIIAKVMATIILSLSIAMLLTACGPVYQTHYKFHPPKSWKGRRCINHCLKARTQCRNRCHRVEQQCRFAAKQAGQIRYLEYLASEHMQHDRSVSHAKSKGQPIPASPQLKSAGDFIDYSGCHHSCGCNQDYRQCYSNCGGQVIAITRCVRFCKTPSTAAKP